MNYQVSVVWEEKNEALRRLGLRTIPNPREAELTGTGSVPA